MCKHFLVFLQQLIVRVTLQLLQLLFDQLAVRNDVLPLMLEKYLTLLPIVKFRVLPQSFQKVVQKLHSYQHQLIRAVPEFLCRKGRDETSRPSEKQLLPQQNKLMIKSRYLKGSWLVSACDEVGGLFGESWGFLIGLVDSEFDLLQNDVRCTFF